MKFKLFFLQFLTIFVLMQSMVFAAYSRTPAALKSFRSGASGRSFQPNSQAPATEQTYQGSSWGSRLEQMMNPQARVFNPEGIMPQATLNPHVVNSVMQTPQANFMVPQSTMVAPFVSMNDVSYMVQNFRAELYRQWKSFVTDFKALSEKSTLEQLDHYKSERDFLNTKKEQLRDFKAQFDQNDIFNLDRLEQLESMLDAVILDRDFTIQELEAQAENAKTYDQNTKNRFYKPAVIGAVGAGTLYGLKKYQKMNN